ncbi:ATP-binding protein [Streptomyces sp. ISL-86]|uniref:ATP-binding protein n=1 Tax=Streptomyces sp. ISL-86 TaxID=2819187 RepID=UPI001BEA77E4|nr:ATP-binding protein [Streptomyces sp. ISL-86]MBT2455761.1 ATP-binding protein [Streptomyces sp. ISL-86]
MERYDVRNYPPRQDSVPAARRRAAWLAVAWGQPQAAADVALLTSELTTNALLHGSVWDRYLRVEVKLTGAVLRVAVTDPKGERRPELRAAADDDQYGRGLHIVSALAERWGASERVVGKTVWAELGITGPG